MTRKIKVLAGYDAKEYVTGRQISSIIFIDIPIDARRPTLLSATRLSIMENTEIQAEIDLNSIKVLRMIGTVKDAAQ